MPDFGLDEDLGLLFVMQYRLEHHWVLDFQPLKM